MINDLIKQDKEQRQLALDASSSFIVQAPAGSGKTELLIQRFLTLLNHVKTPEEILAITFTKKAANEMRSRVIKALKHALTEHEPESEHAKQTWRLAKQVLLRDQQYHWNLINNPNQIRIQTIDALCAYLTMQLPLLSHFGSSPGIADNSASLYREAVQEVLTHVEAKFEWSQAISQLLLHLDNDLNKLHDLLVSLLAKREQWLPYIHVDTNDSEIRKQLECQLEYIITDKLSTVAELFPAEMMDELLAIARFAADNLALSNTESEIFACRDLTDLPGIEASDKIFWQGLAKLVLTKTFSWRKRVDQEIGFPALTSLKNSQEKTLHTEYRQRLNALIMALSEHEDLRLALTELFFLPSPRYQDAQWDILKALLHILKIVAAQLRLTFQQYGQIDFIENAQASLAALGHDDDITDLALSLDYQIRHILVDEFQDTSYTQYQLLEKLITGWEPNDGRSLFVVGDPMQSIYRFREAEVGLFIRMRRNGIGNIKLTPLTLSVNFRSAPKIVEWNNFHFQTIFPALNDMGTGAVTYSRSASNQSMDDDKPSTPVNIYGFANANEQTQAIKIIELIEATKQHHPNDKIAILVRSRAHLTNIIPALKKAKIPYRAVDIDPLASRQSIQDLLSLTCALLHPADRIAWLALLRAPWCGLTLADLLIIAGQNPYAAIWEQLERDEVIQKLSADGQQRLAKILPILKRKIAERERYHLRYWIETTWLLLGGPACLYDESDIDDANAYFKLLDEFDQNNTILNIEKLKEKIAALYASTQHDDAYLQIMTIHTAKGLEFDTVILPHIERRMPNDDKSLLLWMEQPLTNDQTALLLAPVHATGNEKDSIYEYIHRQQKIKSDYETDRLFYVATTRAKKRLYLFFDVNKKEQKDYRIDSGSFLEKLWPFFEKEADTIIELHELDTNITDRKNEAHRYTSRLHSSWVNPIQDIFKANIVSHQQQSGFQLKDYVPKLIGIVSHRVFQQMAEQGVDWWRRRNQNEQITYLEYQLKQLGMLPEQLKAAVDTTYRAITNTLQDERGLWILHAHQEAKSEFAISAVLSDKPESLVIDRTFVDENDVRWIIDYKTATLSYQDLEHFLEKEQEKYMEKMQKYSETMKLIDTRRIKLGLYFPALPAWREWEA